MIWNTYRGLTATNMLTCTIKRSREFRIQSGTPSSVSASSITRLMLNAQELCFPTHENVVIYDISLYYNFVNKHGYTGLPGTIKIQKIRSRIMHTRPVCVFPPGNSWQFEWHNGAAVGSLMMKKFRLIPLYFINHMRRITAGWFRYTESW